MARKFKITIGEKSYIVEVEEISESNVVEVKDPTKPPIKETPSAIPITPTAKVSEPIIRDQSIVRAPMAGVILSIKCKVDDKVEAGNIILTLEAMKMENEISAPKSGVVKRIAVSEKQRVNYGDILIEIE